MPAKSGYESVLESLPLPSDVLADLSELDAATNERKIAEIGGNTAIGPGELLLGVPEAHIVNAAFTHSGPFGGPASTAHNGAPGMQASRSRPRLLRSGFTSGVSSPTDASKGSTRSTTSTSWPTSQACSIRSMLRNKRAACSPIRFRNATAPHSHWRTNSFLKGRMELCTREVAGA